MKRFTPIATPVFLGLAMILGLTFASPIAAEEEVTSPTPITIAIDIPQKEGRRHLAENETFHVVVKNTSDKAIRLWTDKYSRGYDNLSFEQINADGSVVAFNKKPRNWEKNFPDWFELGAGKTHSFAVNLALNDWNNHLVNDAGDGKPTQIKLRATYKISPDNQSAELGVWTGKVESEVVEVDVW